jgi:hypothetical protein
MRHSAKVELGVVSEMVRASRASPATTVVLVAGEVDMATSPALDERTTAVLER